MGLRSGNPGGAGVVASPLPGSLYPRAYERPGLLDWLEEPRTGRGLRFAEDDGNWRFHEYPELAMRATSAARQILENRCADDGPVTIVVPTGPEFVAAFMGSLIAGHTPSPLALPMFSRDSTEYTEHAAAILRTAEPALVIAADGLEGLMTDAAEMAGISGRVMVLEGDAPAEQIERQAPADLALLQFTSGSSGRPRGVQVTWPNLESNIAMIRNWLRMRPDDQTGTWLPLYHDMGLIGCLLTPIVNESDVWIMRPDQFIRDPLRWIECFGSRGVEIGVAPNFGYAYAAKRLTDEILAEMDFTAWRIAIVAAERLDPGVLGRFANRLAPRGFRASSFLPAYGLAEATLASTGVPLEEVPRVVRPDWTTARFGDPLAIEKEARLEEVEEIGGGDGWLVSCGVPHPGVTVAILDEKGEELPALTVGEIAVAGRAIADGYRGPETGSTRFEEGRLLTGDAGFVHGDELFVMGRLGDCLKVRGRTVFVEDVEARLGSIEDVPKGKCVVLAGSEAANDLLLAVVEAPPGNWVAPAASVLRSAVGTDVGVMVIAGPPGTIRRTSSGKPRRRVMWGDFQEDRLGAEILYDSSSAGGD